MPRLYAERPFTSTSPVSFAEALQHLQAGAVLKFLSMSEGYWLSGIDSGVGEDVALTIDRKQHKLLRAGKHLKRNENLDEVYAEPGEVDRIADDAKTESQRRRQAAIDAAIDRLIACSGDRAEIQAVLADLDITWWIDGQNV